MNQLMDRSGTGSDQSNKALGTSLMAQLCDRSGTGLIDRSGTGSVIARQGCSRGAACNPACIKILLNVWCDCIRNIR